MLTTGLSTRFLRREIFFVEMWVLLRSILITEKNKKLSFIEFSVQRKCVRGNVVEF